MVRLPVCTTSQSDSQWLRVVTMKEVIRLKGCNHRRRCRRQTDEQSEQSRQDESGDREEGGEEEEGPFRQRATYKSMLNAIYGPSLHFAPSDTAKMQRKKRKREREG